MSKLCENCGREIKDDAAFCEECGTFQTAGESVGDTRLKVKLTAPKIIFSILAVATLVFLAILEGHLSRRIYDGGGFESALDNTVAVMNGRVGRIKNLAPREFWDKCEEQGFRIDEYVDALEKKLEEDTDGAEDEKYTYKVVSKEKADKELLKRLNDQVMKICGTTEPLVSEAYTVDCDVVLGDGDGKTAEQQRFYVVRIRNSWYPLRAGNFLFDVPVDANEG